MEIPRKTILNDEAYLRQISTSVDFDDDNYKEAIEKLDYFCKNDDNVLAMASIQLGIPLRLVYLKKADLSKLEEDYNESKILINPKIIKSEGLTEYWEACASCMDLTGLIRRPYKIELEYYDVDKNKHTEVFEGFKATVLSHELDHLDGILHIDKAIKILNLEREERVKLRESELYKIIRTTGEYKIDNYVKIKK